MSLRCFIAIELPDALKGEIASRTEGARNCGADAKWVKTENLHLTLKFLGNTSEELMPDIKDALAGAVAGHKSFAIRFKGAGVFPDRKRPRVIWVGIEDSGSLVALQKEVEEAMAAQGFEVEGRAYSPHLTIGRLKSPRRRDLLLKELDTLGGEEFGSIEVTEISMMKSTLKPSGAEYSRLFSVPLGR
jgi:2'-5' RNA ligase